MHAVVIKGGKQYTVSPGTMLQLEKLSGKEGEQVQFSDVLLVNNNGEMKIGAPCVEGFQVLGEIVKQYKAKKILVVKKKRRKGYRRYNGHRQLMTDVKIISMGEAGESPAVTEKNLSAPAENGDSNPIVTEKE